MIIPHSGLHGRKGLASQAEAAGQAAQNCRIDCTQKIRAKLTPKSSKRCEDVYVLPDAWPNV